MYSPHPIPPLAAALQFEDASFEDLQGADARKAMLIIAVMAAHAFGEGSGVGVSFSGERGWAQVGQRSHGLSICHYKLLQPSQAMAYVT